MIRSCFLSFFLAPKQKINVREEQVKKIEITQQIRYNDSDSSKKHESSDSGSSNEDHVEHNDSEVRYDDNKEEAHEEERADNSDEDAHQNEDEEEGGDEDEEGEEDENEEAQQYSDQEQEHLSNNEDEGEEDDQEAEEELDDHDQQQDCDDDEEEEEEDNRPREDDDEEGVHPPEGDEEERSGASEGDYRNGEEEDDDLDDLNAKNEAFLRELENRKTEGKGQINLGAKRHKKSESGGSLDSFQQLEQIVMNEDDNLFESKSQSVENIPETSKHVKQSKKETEVQAPSGKAKKKGEKDTLEIAKPKKSVENRVAQEETPKKSAEKEIKGGKEVVAEQRPQKAKENADKKKQKPEDVPIKQERKREKEAEKIEDPEINNEKQSSLGQENNKASKRSQNSTKNRNSVEVEDTKHAQKTDRTEDSKHALQNDKIYVLTAQSKKKKSTQELTDEIEKEELTSRSKIKETEPKSVPKEKTQQRVSDDRQSRSRKMQDPEDDSEGVVEGNINPKGTKNQYQVIDARGFVEEPQPRLTNRKPKPVVQEKKEIVPHLAYKEKLAESQKKRETSQSPEGFEEGLELKHFKKSKLFQKFVQDSGKKPDLRSNNNKSKQNKAPNKKEQARAFTDENNVGEKSGTKNFQASIKSRGKFSSPQGKFNEFVEEELEDDDINTRADALAESKYSNTLPTRLRDEQSTLDPNSQSMNLNKNSSSQYVPLYPQQQPNQFMNYLGPMQVPYFGMGIPPVMDGNLLQQRNAAYDPRLSPEANEIFFLKGKLREITKSLEREEEANHVKFFLNHFLLNEAFLLPKVLEKRCNDYTNQLEKVMYEIEGKWLWREHEFLSPILTSRTEASVL